MKPVVYQPLCKFGMLTCVYILHTMLFIVFFPLREGVLYFWIFDGET